MSDTASLENCQELYHLMKWQGTQNVWWFKEEPTMYDADEWIVSARANVHQDHIPAYDAGYLLRKLPVFIPKHNGLTLIPYINSKWEAYYDAPKGVKDVRAMADTPEDALAQLAISLFKVGILPISGRDL